MTVDLDFQHYLFRSPFLLPAVVSLGLLIKLWWDRDLFGLSGTAFVFWFAVAAGLQFLSSGVALWALGLVAQTALAFVLLVKGRLAEPFQ